VYTNRIFRYGRIAFCALLLAVVARPAEAVLTPNGGEELINVTTANSQVTPEFACSQNGAFQAAVWASVDQDGDGFGVFARFGGSMVEVQVNQTVAGYQGTPHLSISNTGSVVIVWGADDPTDDSIFARVFTATGVPITGEFLIENLAGQQQLARVDHFPNGNFAVVWKSIATDQVILRAFDSIGSPISPHQVVSTLASPAGVDLAIGANNFGIVTWRVNGIGEGAYYRIVNSSGNWVTPEVQASQTTGDFFYGTAASTKAGGAYIAWIRLNSDGTNTLFIRGIAPNGVPLTPETEVHESAAPFITHIDLSHDAAGRGALVWAETDGVDGDVFVHCLAGAAPVDAAELVNTTTLGRQRGGTVCHDHLGGLTIGWYSEDPAPDDCFVQKYMLGGVSSVDPDGALNTSTVSISSAPSVFRSTTRLELRLAEPGSVEMGVFDVFGRQVRGWDRSPQRAGEFVLTWDGRSDAEQKLPAGTYWFRARVGTSVSSTRLVLLH